MVERLTNSQSFHNAHNIIKMYEEDLGADVFDHNLVKENIAFNYNKLSKELKAKYTILDFEKELKKIIIQAVSKGAVAESHNLPKWLSTHRRLNENHETRFKQYQSYLINDDKGTIVEQIDADTYEILDRCHNPNELAKKWDRRGLVYGHVQSGKTANYIGLINRAFDSGYQIVIVLTGMTEDLRIQTQNRIDAAVLGLIANKDVKHATSYNMDLSSAKSKENLKYLSFKDKSIWVIKKNKTILENLIEWLDKQRKIQNSEKIEKVPFLIIDDEADNASIQSLSKKDFDKWNTGMTLDHIDFEDMTKAQKEVYEDAKTAVIKTINRNIRVVLSLIAHKSFVAYTATPYSVITQSSEDLARSVVIKGEEFQMDRNNDLFPKDFIIPITAGENYIGIEKLFNDNDKLNLPVIKDVEKSPYFENLDDKFPTRRGEDYNWGKNIPNSLEDAILHYFISVVIRKYRNPGKDYFNSMLIHTSHLTKNADYVASRVDKYVMLLYGKLKNEDTHTIKRFNSIMNDFKRISSNHLFKKYFGEYSKLYPDNITYYELIEVFQKLKIVSYHSSKDPSLIYRGDDLDYSDSAKPANYIVIGGNRLSRGLTLEGLITSYFVRKSSRQDSLYQMGRWFGYRSGYEDLVRIFIPSNRIHWFNGIFKLEMNLRTQFEENNDPDSPIMPKDALIRLRVNTDRSLSEKYPAICDPNKLRKTEKAKISFQGFTKSNNIINDKQIQLKNLLHVKNILSDIEDDQSCQLFDNNNLFQDDDLKNNNINYTNVDYKYVLSLLKGYQCHSKLMSDFENLYTFIEVNKIDAPKWSLVLAQKPNNKKELGIDWVMKSYDKGNKKATSNKISGVQRKWESSPKSDDYTKYFSQFLDKKRDNSFDIIDENNIDDYRNGKTIQNIRSEKKIPILIIYPVVYEDMSFPLYYFAIPEGIGEPVDYIVRKTWK